jgi:hypothetical protein
MRIATQQSMEAGRQIAGPDVWLRALELYIPKLMFEIMAGKKLPDNRSWLKEEEYIDLVILVRITSTTIFSTFIQTFLS